VVRETGGALCIQNRIFRIARRQGMELVYQTFELVLILLRGVILEPNGSAFNAWRQVIVRSAALHSRAIGVRGRLMQ